MTNSDLSSFIDSLEKDVDKAKSENDLLAVCKRVSEFLSKGGKMTYDFSTAYIIALISLVLSIGIGYFFFIAPEPIVLQPEWINIAILVVPIIVFIVSIGYVFSLSSAVDDLSGKMFRKDVLFDNLIVHLPIFKNEYKRLNAQFGDFDRGDQDHTIEKLLEIPITIGNAVSIFRYYQFSYVVVTYETKVVSDGKGGTTTQTRRVETTYYRYGIIGEFPWAKSILVRNCGGGVYDYPLTHTTGSSKFNRLYNVATSSIHAAEKFLKPVIILALEDTADYISGMAMEINQEGKMCISFSNSDLIDVGRKYSLEDIDNFTLELAGKNHPPKLLKITQLIKTLVEHNDSNF